MSAVLATVPKVGTGRVALVVSSRGLAAGCPWTVTLDGRSVGFFGERSDALRWVALLEDVVEGPDRG